MPKQPTPYVPQAPQLARGIEHVCYEYGNLMAAAYWTMHGAAPWRTHADDAFLLGYRKLADFLLYTRRSQRQGKELPDILARDYLSTRAKPEWTLPTWKKEWAFANTARLSLGDTQTQVFGFKLHVFRPLLRSTHPCLCADVIASPMERRQYHLVHGVPVHGELQQWVQSGVLML